MGGFSALVPCMLCVICHPSNSPNVVHCEGNRTYNTPMGHHTKAVPHWYCLQGCSATKGLPSQHPNLDHWDSHARNVSGGAATHPIA